MQLTIFQVITERDGDTCTAPGVTSTEILREEFYFAASGIDVVWEATDWLRDNITRRLVSITDLGLPIRVLK
jgi:hypothetical protein